MQKIISYLTAFHNSDFIIINDYFKEIDNIVAE